MKTNIVRSTLLAALTLLACSSPDRSDESVQLDAVAVTSTSMAERGRMDMPAAAPAPPIADFGSGAAGSAERAEFESKQLAQNTAAPAQTPITSLPDSVRPPMLIRNGSATVRVDSVARAIAAVRALADRLGGYVPDVSIVSGEQQTREARLTLRIPAARFDEALSGLQPIGKVDVVHVSSEDVGEEYVDIEMRLANGRRLEQRLLDLLERRTGALEDVLAVERELARVRGEIERQEGRLRYLRNRITMSTLAVTVYEPGPILAHVGENVIVRALKQAVRNFVNLVAAIIASLGVVLPILAVVAGGWMWWRRRRRRETVLVSAPPLAAGND